MSQKKVYLAVDLGAGSGRVLAGEFDGRRIELHEINRFENIPVQLPSGWHWNITGLYQNILEGLKLAAETYADVAVSIGVDTWGVDYGLFDKDGRLLGLPYQYRDNRTDGIMEKVFEKTSKEKIYNTTGIQFIFFNTLFQLYSELVQKNPALEQAEDLLFMPDIIGYWLTGQKTQERSIVSTSQLYDPKLGDWDFELIKTLGLPAKLFKKISDPGEALGVLSSHIAEYTGLKDVQVITVAGHDTGSAVAAVPSQAETPAYLSSGSWSLLGLGVMSSSFLWRGLLARQKDGMPLALACFGSAITAVIPLLYAGTAGILISAFGFGAVFFMGPAAVTALSKHNLPAVLWSGSIALYTTGFAIGQTLGPIGAGMIADWLGSLDGALVAGSIVLGLASITSILQRRFRQA